MEINIHDFETQYFKEYNFLYAHRDNVAGYAEAVEAFNSFLKGHADFVGAFCNYIGDLITSDR